MNPRSQGIFVACKDSAVFVRVVGRGACKNSETLRTFGLEKLSAGFTDINVDLQQCDGMDSTFLGVFAGFALAEFEKQGSLRILNLKGECLKAFISIGLDHVATVETLAPDAMDALFPPESEFELLPGSDLTAKSSGFQALERALLMLECHEDLCRIDERNEEKFRDVKQFLREDIARHGPGC